MNFTKTELDESHKALLSSLLKGEKIKIEKLPMSQQTLLTRRIFALKVALELIEREIGKE